KFTWDTLTDPNTKFAARSLLTPIAGVEAPDARTLTFRFRQVSATAFLVTDLVPPIPRHVFAGEDINTTALNRENTVGSGPFVLQEWVADDHATFVANAHYWRGRPKLDQYRFRVLPDVVAAYRALQNGEVDAAPLPPQLWDQVSRRPEFQALTYYY